MVWQNCLESSNFVSNRAPAEIAREASSMSRAYFSGCRPSISESVSAVYHIHTRTLNITARNSLEKSHIENILLHTTNDTN